MEGSHSSELVPAGFHPTLITEYTTTSADCPLYARYSIPPAFIVDRFQLAQLHAEGRLGSLPSIGKLTLSITGERDLEAPTGRTGESIVLLRLSEGGNYKGKGKERGTVVLPLHLRYQIPVDRRRNERGERMDLLDVGMEAPVLFWACPASIASSAIGCLLSTLPNLTAHFPPTTHLNFLDPSSASPCTLAPPTMLSVKIPTGVASDLPFVEISNFLVIWSGLIWIVWTTLSSRRRYGKKGKRIAGGMDKND